jgi:dihydroorotase
MSDTILLVNGSVVNEGITEVKDILIRNGRIEKIAGNISATVSKTIDCTGQHILPGAIDDQVHFREPGLTHKGDLYTEPKAAIAGGITSYMEMPNTSPPALTQQLLTDKYLLAEEKSLANYSFFMGVSNENYDEVMRTDKKNVCGIKVFMGSSTGNMLVDNEHTLTKLFANAGLLIATHCESESRIKQRSAEAKAKFGEDVPPAYHSIIRDADACFESSSFAVDLAKSHGTRLHVLHISTAKELQLFSNGIPLENKKITAEACIHHLWFSDQDYEKLGMMIKWNPAIKTMEDRDAVLQAVIDDRIDIIATDHAPHTLAEKKQSYFNAPSGGPLVQHALPAMLDLFQQGKITLEKIAEKMAHSVALCYNIADRGFLREGYFADIAVVNLALPFTVTKENILYKCGWSPFEHYNFKSSVIHTLVNGRHVYNNGRFDESSRGMRLTFNR